MAIRATLRVLKPTTLPTVADTLVAFKSKEHWLSRFQNHSYQNAKNRLGDVLESEGSLLRSMPTCD